MSNTYQDWIKNLRLNITGPTYPEAAIRWTPDIDMPETIGYTLTNNFIGLETISFLGRTNGNKYDVENQTTLYDVLFPYLAIPGANIVISGNPALSSLFAPNIQLPLFGSSLVGSSLIFAGNNINSNDVDSLFNQLALSLSSGHAYYCTIDTSGGTNGAATAASAAARGNSSLGAAGYHITVKNN